MSFPREESLTEVVGDATYVERVRWRLFMDPKNMHDGMQVLIRLGDRYTLVDGQQFRQDMARILRQLE